MSSLIQQHRSYLPISEPEIKVHNNFVRYDLMQYTTRVHHRTRDTRQWYGRLPSFRLCKSSHLQSSARGLAHEGSKQSCTTRRYVSREQATCQSMDEYDSRHEQS